MKYCYLKTFKGTLIGDLPLIIEQYSNVELVLDDMTSNENLKKILSKMKQNDVFIINDFSSISRSVNELEEIVILFKKLHIRFICIENKIDSQTDEYSKLYDILLVYFTGNRVFKSSYAKVLLEDKKNEGIFLGRPKIEEELIEKIINFRNNEKLNYRTIAEKTGVSLGTVHKYLKDSQKD